MSDSLISVLVPVYNSEQTLNRCIDSILGQTYRNFELLLINDGSKDRSGEICDEYARRDSRVKVFHKENGGVSSARNVGLDNARGEWITFCDSDDYYNLDAFDIYFKLTTLSGDISIIRAGYNAISALESTKISCYELSILDCNSDVFSFIEKTRYYGFLWNSLFRKKEIANLRFDDTICWSEDHIFSAIADYHCKKIVFVPDIVYNHIFNDSDSLSSPKDPYMIKRAANIEFNAKKRLYDRDMAPIPLFCVDIYRNVLLWSVKVAFSNLDYKEQKRFLKQFTSMEVCDERLGKFLTALRSRHIPLLVKYVLCKLYFQ